MRYERMPVEIYARACRDVRVCPKEFKDKSAEMYGYVCRNDVWVSDNGSQL